MTETGDRRGLAPPDGHKDEGLVEKTRPTKLTKLLIK